MVSRGLSLLCPPLPWVFEPSVVLTASLLLAICFRGIVESFCKWSVIKIFRDQLSGPHPIYLPDTSSQKLSPHTQAWLKVFIEIGRRLDFTHSL